MKWRYQCILYLFLFSFLGVIARLFYWQVVEASSLSQQAQSQYGSLITVQPKRGNIDASDGFPLVTNRLSYLVFANPKEISNVQDVSQKLSPILGIEVATLSARLSLNGYWVSLESGLDAKTKSEIESLNIPGIGFEQSYTRLYPEASMAASLVGFVGKDVLGNNKGYFGLEGYYDGQLKGRVGQAIEIHDALGRPILSQLSGNGQAEDGRTIVTTINRSFQYLAEEELNKGIQEFGADSGMIAIMDPKTGDILAMANYPSFSEEDYWDYNTSLYKNPFITNLYEPGSTMKPIVMAGAIDRGLLKPTSTCPICSGAVQIGNYAVHTWNDQYFPNTTMQDVLIHSDNTGMVYVSEKMGLNNMLANFKAFGLDDPTGIDLQGEGQSTISDRQTWYPIDVATSAFGQGVAVTPMELLDAFSAIANNGVRMEPHLVSKIITPDGQTIAIQPKVLSRPISAETSKIMTEMLVATVNKGEAAFARLKGYRIAGKTGTASIPVSGHYDPTQTIASFIGFAPADDPKFVMLVIFDRPVLSIWGSETAAPTFFDISQKLLDYYGIPQNPNDP